MSGCIRTKGEMVKMQVLRSLRGFFSLSQAKLGLWDILTSFWVILTQVCSKKCWCLKTDLVLSPACSKSTGGDIAVIITQYQLSIVTWWNMTTAAAAASVVSDSSWPHGLQPSRLLCPWDFPGKNTGAGCHCLLQEHDEPSPKSSCSKQWTFT